MNGSERSGSALSYVTNRSVRGLSEGVQGLEVIAPVLPIDKGKGREVEALLVEPTPEPVPSSEEEEDEEETLEVVRSDTPLPVREPVPQVHGQRSSLVGPVCNTSNGPRSLGPYPVDGHRRVRSEDEWDSPVYSCCVKIGRAHV